MGGKKKKAKAQEQADQAAQLERMGEAAGAYSARRPHTQQALNAALQQQLSAFQGINTLLGQMGLEGLPSSEQYGNIVTPELLSIGRTSRDPNMGAGVIGGEGETSGGGEGSGRRGGSRRDKR